MCLFKNNFFYFRSRGEWATIEFARSEEDFDQDNIYVKIILLETALHRAGWLPKWFCTVLVWWGCAKFWYKYM